MTKKAKTIWAWIATAAILLAAVAVGLLTRGSNPNPDPQPQAALVPENIISTDREALFLQYGSEIGWYETDIKLQQPLDSITDAETAEIASVTNYLQLTHAEMDSTTHRGSVTTGVYIIPHLANGETWTDPHPDTFILDDRNMSEAEINITFRRALDIALSTNYQKPAGAHHCVLRWLCTGYSDPHPVYIFGNQKGQILVDAATGEANDTYPIVPED